MDASPGLLGPFDVHTHGTKAASVARLSSPSRKPLTAVTPSASEPSMMERWEIDLSPGTRSAR